MNTCKIEFRKSSEMNTYKNVGEGYPDYVTQLAGPGRSPAHFSGTLQKGPILNTLAATEKASWPEAGPPAVALAEAEARATKVSDLALIPRNLGRSSRETEEQVHG